MKGQVIDERKARERDLARIHIGKKALHWDDAQYRDILWTVCQVRSAKDLDFTGRKRFIDHLKRCGWTDQAPRVARPGRPVRKELSKPQKKMWSLWQQLADAGLVENRRMPGLMAFIQRQTSVERLEWLNGPQEDLVIESLKRWLERRGR